MCNQINIPENRNAMDNIKTEPIDEVDNHESPWLNVQIKTEHTHFFKQETTTQNADTSQTAYEFHSCGQTHIKTEPKETQSTQDETIQTAANVSIKHELDGIKEAQESLIPSSVIVKTEQDAENTLKQHKATQKHPIVQLQIDLDPTPTNLEPTDVTKPHKCAVCSKTFSQKAYLKKHALRHTDTKPYVCSTCGKRFYERSNLTQHQACHSGVRYACDACGKSFAVRANLTSHLKRHVDQKTFDCPTCAKTFTHEAFLRRHLVRHTGIKPFKCEQCDQRFTEKSTLVKHEIGHSGVRYTCDTCRKQFTRKENLKLHIRTHTGLKPYACTLCESKFTSKPHLSQHLRTHAPKPHSKVFVCLRCGKGFSSKRGLNDHVERHIGIKVYQCDKCEKSFTTKRACYLHSYRRHRDVEMKVENTTL